jgi:signal recognition particle receptor subunit beta
MVQINFGQREVSCKLVYYGPGMSGKTTNLEIIHQKAPANSKGEMVSIATETDRTLYFDYLPLDLGQVAGMHTKFQLYTVPGQIYYNATRKLVLQGVDGVIFVADSSKDKMAENLESLQNLRDNLGDMGLNLDELPLVIQYNKRDLPEALPVSILDEQINPMGVATCEAVAKDGKGVFTALKLLSKMVIEKLNTEHAPGAQRRRTANDLRPASNVGAGPVPASMQPAATPSRGASALPSNTPASGNHAIPPAPVPVPRMPAPSAGTPTPPAPQARRNQHLNKASPQPLGQNRPAAAPQRGVPGLDPGTTDPNLRRYKQEPKGGGVVKTLLIIFLTILIMLVLLVVLVLFVEPVRNAIRPWLPEKIQYLLMDPAPTPAGPSDPTTTPTDTPATPALPATDETAP